MISGVGLSGMSKLKVRDVPRVPKKKDAPFFSFIKQIQKMIKIFFIETFLKIFKKSFNVDQSNVCISNGLGVRAFQRETLFC